MPPTRELKSRQDGCLLILATRGHCVSSLFLNIRGFGQRFLGEQRWVKWGYIHIMLSVLKLQIPPLIYLDGLWLIYFDMAVNGENMATLSCKSSDLKKWGKLLTRATCFQAANIFPQSPVQVIFLFSGWIVAQSMVRFTLCMEMDALISSMTKDRRAMTRFCHYLCWWARILSGSSSSPLVWLQFIRQLIWQLRHWNRRA